MMVISKTLFGVVVRRRDRPHCKRHFGKCGEPSGNGVGGQAENPPDAHVDLCVVEVERVDVSPEPTTRSQPNL